MLSAKPKDAIVSRMGIQHRLPNLFTNSATKTTYRGTNAHLLLKNIIIGSKDGDAHFWLINTNKSLSKKSSRNNIPNEYQLFLEITMIRGEEFSLYGPKL